MNMLQTEQSHFRVCHVIAGLPDEAGGPTQVVLGLTRALTKKGIETSIFMTNVTIGGTVSQEFLDNLKKYEKLVEIQHFNIEGPWWYAYSSELKKALNSHARTFDLFHIHGLWMYPTSAAMAVARKLGIPYVLTPHGALNEWAMRRSRWKKRLLLALWERKNIRSSGAVHFFHSAEPISSMVRAELPRTVYIPNGIDPESLEPMPPRGLFRDRFRLHDRQIVLFLGRLHPVKGLDLLVEAFEGVAQRRSNVVLVIAGPDTNGYREILERNIARRGLSACVILPGMLMGVEKRAALADADLLILPSYQEGQSMAVTEALCCGVPVVITNACHMPEVAIHGAGLIVENSATDLMEAILVLLDHPEMRKKMGEAGKLLAGRLYSWSSIAGEMSQVYREMLETKIVSRSS
jgi:glycosyltransferase involved in cell wall biosynthesis